MPSQNLLRYVVYCDLYCELSAHRNRIPQKASQLQESLQKECYDNWYEYVSDFKDVSPPFWQFLKNYQKKTVRAEQAVGPKTARSAMRQTKKR